MVQEERRGLKTYNMVSVYVGSFSLILSSALLTLGFSISLNL